jgi:hypothetical protein
MNTLLFLVCLFLVAGVSCQRANDPLRINPKECGMSLENAANQTDIQRRYLSSDRADQKNWAWHVMLNYGTDTGSELQSGSLINSQWVLTRALNLL